MMRDRLESMGTEAQKNKETVKVQQKTWYDKRTRERSFQPRDQVLVLLPTSASKLNAQWQGPYTVEERVSKVNYKLRIPDRRKKAAVFHINMLQRWHTPIETGFLTMRVSDELEDIPYWDDTEDGAAKVGNHLTQSQVQELHSLLNMYDSVFQDLPGHTTLAEYHIPTDKGVPVRLPPYRIPHAFREEVHKELKEMLKHGIIEPSTSDWASPLVTVQKKDKSLRLCVDYK